MSDNKHSKMTVSELFDAYCESVSPANKAYLKHTLSQCAKDGSREAEHYVYLINKR